MLIINFLHFYQPYNQQSDILDRIVNESYRPIVRGLLERPNAKLVANISGVLTRLLRDKGYEDVLEGISELVKRGQVELTGSGMYHAMLPLLPENEISRQIELHELVNKEIWGDLYQPSGFFSPELAVNDKTLRVVKEFGYKWIAAPELAYGPVPAMPDKFYQDQKTGLTVFFRNKRVSVMMLSATVRDAETLIEVTQDLHKKDKYWFTVMDAETFGHHRIGHEKLLFEIFDSEFFKSMTASELLKQDLPIPVENIELRPSTWSNQEQDFWLDREQKERTSDKSFILWRDPDNPIHRLQWELTEFVIGKVDEYQNKSDQKWLEARNKLDRAVASDQYWWASARPWWSLEMIEQGAFALKDVLITLNPADSLIQKADKLYRQILDQAFEWQRTGYIRKKHLEASGTYHGEPFKERAPVNWYNEIVLAMEDEMNRAAAKQDFENALKWRDALYKLNHGTDIYDVLHVVDDFWQSRNLPWGFTGVKPFFDHEWEEFSDFAIKHFKDYKTKVQYEEGKSKFLNEHESLYASDVWGKNGN